jgi:hypothetical protein
MIHIELHESVVPLLLTVSASSCLAGMLVGYGFWRVLDWLEGPRRSSVLTALEREDAIEEGRLMAMQAFHEGVSAGLCSDVAHGSTYGPKDFSAFGKDDAP